jgi:predicted metal-dependent HD superfamily phosphohydrolase
VIWALQDRWDALWRKLGIQAVSQNGFEELVRAYSAPDRFYHNLVHVQDCLSVFDRTKSLAFHPEEVELAIWFHDAVYDAKRSDNEHKSAEWAAAVIKQAGLHGNIDERVSNSILATRHNQKVTDRDAQLMVDVDLSILGKEPNFFWQYEENIRKEYAWVPESLFRVKRVKVLRGFLESQYIYYHEKYRDMFEAQARANLQQAIARLTDKRESV